MRVPVAVALAVTFFLTGGCNGGDDRGTPTSGAETPTVTISPVAETATPSLTPTPRRPTPTATTEPAKTEEPEPTPGEPHGELPDGYPEEEAPIPAGTEVVSARRFAAGQRDIFTLLLRLPVDVETVLDLYTLNLEAAGWRIETRGVEGGRGRLTASRGAADAPDGSLIVDVVPVPEDGEGAEVALFLAVSAPR